MTRKIIARQVPPESQESTWEYWPSERYVLVNRWDGSYTTETYDFIIENIEFWDEYDSVEELLDSEDIERADGKTWSTEQLAEWNDIVSGEYFTDGDEETVCRLLSLIDGGNWQAGVIRGCSQSDWYDIYYDADVWDDDRLAYLEAEVFNTGTEWCCTEDDDEEACYYTIYSDYDDIREDIAGYYRGGDEDVEVELQAFDGWDMTARYKAV